MDCGDRLGHALALGIDVEEWYKSKNNYILLPQQDYLDNLVWIYNRLIQFNIQGMDQIDFTYKIFVCNHCFETWLLGNRVLFPEERPDGDFQTYYDSYNIKDNDPEMMPVPQDVQETIAKYHFHYLHEMCRYNKIRYSKNKPMFICLMIKV